MSELIPSFLLFLLKTDSILKLNDYKNLFEFFKITNIFLKLVLQDLSFQQCMAIKKTRNAQKVLKDLKQTVLCLRNKYLAKTPFVKNIMHTVIYV